LPEGCDLEIAIVGGEDIINSDAGHDAAVLRFLEPVLAHCSETRKTVALYPHVSCWLERFDDALRLCRAADHPQLRAVFCGYHWFAVEDSSHALRDNLRDGVSYLVAANLCGSRKPSGAENATVEPLDSGSLDNFALYGWLRGAGFNGRIGVQAFSIGGDVLENYRRSLHALQRWEEQFQAHSQWTSHIIAPW
jgi:sugar phosphate isomerase/epimerase